MRGKGRIASLVLAAGAGKRFGGRKQLARLEGRPLLDHALAIAAASDTDLTVLVLGAFAGEIEAAIELDRVRVVRCPDWELGRAASLRAGLAALPDDVEAVLVTLADEPYVSPAAAARLLAGRRPGVAALRATYAGRPGHPVLIERELFGPLAAPAGDRSPGQILAAAGARSVACDDLGTSVDVDTPAQLERLIAHPPVQSGRPSSSSE